MTLEMQFRISTTLYFPTLCFTNMCDRISSTGSEIDESQTSHSCSPALAMLPFPVEFVYPSSENKPRPFAKGIKDTEQWGCLNYAEHVAQSFSFWAIGLSWQTDFVGILRVFAIGNCPCLIWSPWLQSYREPRKEMGWIPRWRGMWHWKIWGN